MIQRAYNFKKSDKRKIYLKYRISIIDKQHINRAYKDGDDYFILDRQLGVKLNQLNTSYIVSRGKTKYPLEVEGYQKQKLPNRFQMQFSKLKIIILSHCMKWFFL